MTTTEQTTDTGLWGNPRKRADELKAGDMILVDGDPIEITHVQPVPGRGDRDPRILVVYADAGVTTWRADVMAPLATDEQIAQVRNRRAWDQVIGQMHEWLAWMSDHADRVPAPNTLNLYMQHTFLSETDEQVRHVTAAAAQHLGTEMMERPAYEGARRNTVTTQHQAALDGGDTVLNGELKYVTHGSVDPATADLKPISHWRAGVGAACELSLRLVDRCVDDLAHVDCLGCLSLAPTAKQDPQPLRLVEPGPQVDPALADRDEDREAREDFQAMGAVDDREPLTVETSEESAAIVDANLRAMDAAGLTRPSYDPNPTIVLHRGETYADKYAAYATVLDVSNPGWWNDNLDRMAPTLAELARERRAETWGEGELDHDRVPTTAGFEAHEGARRERAADGEFAPTAPCGACGAVAEPTVGA
jgi:hypothetical protein